MDERDRGWERRKEGREGKKEGGREERKGRPAREGERKPSPVGNTPSTPQRSSFLFIICEYSPTEPPSAGVGSVSGQRRVEKPCFLYENHGCCLCDL